MSKKPYSLEKKLVIYTSIFSIIMGCILVFATYRTALEETNEILDAQMRSLAERVAKLNPTPIKSEFSSTIEYHEEDLFIDVWAYDERIHLHDDSHQLLDKVEKAGFFCHENQYGTWHSYVIPLKNVQVQVSQQDTVRQALAFELAINMFLPYILIMPFAIYGISFIIKRNFIPFQNFKSELSDRKPNILTEINPENYPRELIPSIEVFNQLFQRISEAQLEQKQFIADAAHELRTPITALNLQNKILLKEFPDHPSLIQMNKGLQRTQHLVGQLLELAQQDALSSHNECKVLILLDKLVILTIEQLIHLALAKNIDLGMDQQHQVQFINYYSSVQTIITNLIDNAIKYTPSGGVINVSSFYEDEYAVFQVEDSGSGIAPELFDDIKKRFYRINQHQVIGSGLGLSIVEKATIRLNAKLIFGQSKKLGGLLVKVLIPRE